MLITEWEEPNDRNKFMELTPKEAESLGTKLLAAARGELNQCIESTCSYQVLKDLTGRSGRLKRGRLTIGVV